MPLRVREKYGTHIYFKQKRSKYATCRRKNAPEEFIGEREIYRYLLSPISSLVQKDVSRDPQKN